MAAAGRLSHLRHMAQRPAVELLRSSSRALTHSRETASAARRTAVRAAWGFGVAGVLGASATATFVLHTLAAEVREQQAAEQDDRAKAYERHRKEEIERISEQVSLRRLLHLVFIMLPVAIAWPVWLVSPTAFWAFVAQRVDLCGPCFVKLAQWLATRVDLFPENMCHALAKMHHQVSAAWSTGISPMKVMENLRAAEVDLQSLEPRPHASGSIAEVYFGQLSDGTEVAVKCLRPGVRHLLESDLAWLLRLGKLADGFEPLRLLGLRRAAEEFAEHVQMQTNFEIEADHLRRFRENFSRGDGGESVRFPQPLYVTEDALVLSREKGQELAGVFRAAASRGRQHREDERSPSSSSTAEAVKTGTSRADQVRETLGIHEALSRTIAKESMALYMRMIFQDQFIHGDLHPGNIMLQLRPQGDEEQRPTDGETCASSREPSRWSRLRQRFLGASSEETQPFQLVVLDAGLAIPLPREKVEALRALTISIIYGEYARAAEILYNQSPDSSKCWDPSAFKQGLANAFRDCRKQVWEEGFVQVSEACLEALRLVRHYNVGLDTTLTWTLFGMLSIEGSARQLDPEVDCAEAATRYILTIPSLAKELQSCSWQTAWHMTQELVFQKLGIDYWEWQARRGLTWSTFDNFVNAKGFSKS